MTVTVTATRVPERPAHRDGNVLRWLGAYTASMVGDSVYYMALAWAATRTGTASQAGFVLAAGSIPRAVLMLGGESSPTGSGPGVSSSAATPRAAWSSWAWPAP